MKKVLIATVKPFAPAAISQMKQLINDAGYDMVLLEKYGDRQELLNAV